MSWFEILSQSRFERIVCIGSCTDSIAVPVSRRMLQLFYQLCLGQVCIKCQGLGEIVVKSDQWSKKNWSEEQLECSKYLRYAKLISFPREQLECSKY